MEHAQVISDPLLSPLKDLGRHQHPEWPLEISWEMLQP